MNDNNKHKHHDVIIAFANGAQIEGRPTPNSAWSLFSNPSWENDWEYRVKPEENEPWKPKEGEKYYYMYAETFEANWVNDTYDNKLLNSGNVFRTRGEAEDVLLRAKAALKDTTDVSGNVGSNVGSKDAEIKALKGEVGDKVMSREEADSAMRSAIGLTALVDRDTSLERENKALKNELETLQIRCENLHKAKEQLIASHAAVDGVTLTNGEISLIKALRRPERIIDVYDYRTTVLVSANDNASMVDSIRQHIAFFTSAWDSDDVLIIDALKQIKAEREAGRK